MHEVFEHTADIGLRIRAADLPNLFREAAEGLFELIVANLDQVQFEQEVNFKVTSRQGENDYLLFDWLNELLYSFDTSRLVLAKFDVQFTTEGLQAKAWGEPLNPARHRLEHEVKAITYHGLKVAQESDGWLAEVIVDI
jgi:SHS2 domain-containing protein